MDSAMLGIVAAALGVVVGLALGALGGGGSVLALPSLVYVLHQDPHAASTASLVIVIASASAGLVSHARAGHVKVRAGLGFGLAGLVTSIAASALAPGLPRVVMLGGFAVLMLVAAVLMWRAATATNQREQQPDSLPGESVGGGGRRSVAAGAGVGVLIGVFGVGGGFLAVPALISVAGFTMADAVGTSLLIITVNAGAAVATRIGQVHLDWAVVAPFAAAAAIAAVLGRRVSGRFSAARLQRAFAVLLIALAGWVLLEQAAVAR